MNITDMMINGSINWTLLDQQLPFAPFRQECTGSEFYTINCMNKLFCPQIKHWVMQTALVLVIVYLCHLWIIDAFFWICDKTKAIEFEAEHKRAIHSTIKDIIMGVMACFMFILLEVFRY